MSRDRQLISDKRTLISQYYTLTKDDIIHTILPLKSGEEHLLLDLRERGIKLIPSATAQLASRSKAFQAILFKPWMVPGSTVIYDANQLLGQISSYNELKIGKVVVKLDRKNAGLGILLYNNIEDIYNQAAGNTIRFPFVIQPFIENSSDLRVIILGDYIEAYRRSNPHNFRQNLHCGGTSQPQTLSPEQLSLCTRIMERGSFPYAHLDLMVTPLNHTYLAEISLRGGMHGASISKKDYRKKIESIELSLIHKFSNDRQ